MFVIMIVKFKMYVFLQFFLPVTEVVEKFACHEVKIGLELGRVTRVIETEASKYK
jgi:hypothetical protein